MIEIEADRLADKFFMARAVPGMTDEQVTRLAERSVRLAYVAALVGNYRRHYDENNNPLPS